MFTLPASSSPPSTPIPQRKAHDPRAFAASTTPGGAPLPSPSGPSTTPAGPPPSSGFESSRYNSSVPFPGDPAIKFSALDDRFFHSVPASQTSDDVYDAMEQDDEFEAQGGRPVYLGDVHNIPYLAKALSSIKPQLQESDDLILSTEHILETLHREVRTKAPSANTLVPALSSATKQLIGVWESGHAVSSGEGCIGPGPSASSTSKAIFLAKLQFALHHQPLSTRVSHPLRDSASRPSQEPIPGVLIDWLQSCHKSLAQEVEELLESDQDPSGSDAFWDTVLACTLRGQVEYVINLLDEANFEHAISALDEGAAQPGYHGRLLGNVQRVIGRAVKLLQSCPGVQGKNWNTKDADWAMFRKRVHQALSDLESFAEGGSYDHVLTPDGLLEAENFGMFGTNGDGLSLHDISQRAESKVPWTIYQNLKAIYGTLLGTSSVVVASAGDWLEATMGLTIWWDGGDEAKKETGLNRRSVNKSYAAPYPGSDSAALYRQRLASAFQTVLTGFNDAELQVNPQNEVEVALACIVINDVEGLVGVLRGLSNTLSAAVVEIGGLGGWLGGPLASGSITRGLDESDLMVLSYAKQASGTKRDDVLIHYARLLAARPSFEHSQTKAGKEGWQIAAQVLNRLDNNEAGNEQMRQILERVEVTSADRVEKVFIACNRSGLTNLARSVSQRYADYLSETTLEYGDALYYYARAHNEGKIRDVANLLISLCVVQSAAYPPLPALDKTMRALLTRPMQTLARLDRLDSDAAGLLSTCMSGYATIRKIYDLRDRGPLPGNEDGERLGRIAQRKAAASALVTAITSASDSIHGGLYDSTIESVVPVDVLLTLLGEALIFVHQPKRVLTSNQVVAILRAVDNLSTVSPNIFEQCEECLKSALGQSQGLEIPSPHALMKKSTLSMTMSSRFPLIDSATMRQQARGGSEVSGAITKSTVKRAWDWRKGMEKDAVGQDVLKILRMGLAEEIAQTWILES